MKKSTTIFLIIPTLITLTIAAIAYGKPSGGIYQHILLGAMAVLGIALVGACLKEYFYNKNTLKKIGQSIGFVLAVITLIVSFVALHY